LGFSSNDFGYTEVSSLDELFFYARPEWNIEGPFQEFYFPPPLESPSNEERILQVQQYFLPQGIGSLEPRPEGVLIFVFGPGDTSTFLLFPSSPPMPAPWWSAIDSEIASLVPGEAEAEFRQFMTQAQGTEKELYLDPRTEFLQKVLFDWESRTGTIGELDELTQEVGEVEAQILRMILPRD
jgi:hypothetical protein